MDSECLKVSLVPTRPDTTQYQVMRLMRHRKWRHVRVLNLSDLRCSKSTQFFRIFQRLEREQGFEAHSIFSQARSAELSLKLPRGTPVVLAWGLSPRLNSLIERCLARLGSRVRIWGLLEPGTEDKYRHPLPSLQSQQRDWLRKMVREFDAKESTLTRHPSAAAH